MSRVLNKISKVFNKNHYSMILVLLTLLMIIPFNASAKLRNYSDFSWDAFYEKNKNYWSSLCENDEKVEECRDGILSYQKDFYTKLYKILAKYQEKGLYISDDIIVETVFFELLPSYTGNPTQDNVYKSRYSVYGNKAQRSAIKIDEYEEDPSINDNYDADEDELNSMAAYYDNETDTLKVLTKNMVAYYTYCYGSYGAPVIEEAGDGSSRATCPNGGQVTKVIRHNKLLQRQIEVCADNISASAGAPGYELGFWNYYSSRLEHDTFLGVIAKFFGSHVKDEHYEDCMSRKTNYPDGTYYVYVDQADNDGAHVSTNKFFDFLKTSKYFDSKPHLQHRFKDVIEKAGVECLTSVVCDNSLEAKGEYDKYQTELENDRFYIIAMIIDVLNRRGMSLQYDGYGTQNFDDVEYNRAERSGYYWPIGSAETTERDGIVYADGTPTKTMNDIESYFGERKNPITGDKEIHYGIDITTEEGVTNIVAAYQGVVASIYTSCTNGDYECNEGYGNTVIISHSNGDYTVYAHLSSIDSQIKVGSSVNRGELLGKAGSTGETKTSNLHYELRLGGNSVTNAVDPIANTSVGNDTPPSDGDLRPGGYSGSGIGARSPKFDGTSLTRDEYVSRLSAYCLKKPQDIAPELCADPGMVYDTSRGANVNPELVIARAMAEGNSPGESRHNYWGMGCTNTGGLSACITYGSVQEGIRGFGNNVQQYNTLSDMMHRYAYIGKNWYNPGSWSIGGCKYFPYIKDFMTSTRAATVAGICGKSTQCTIAGGDCTPTVAEDQDAYASWQVEKKMGPCMHNVFGS